MISIGRVVIVGASAAGLAAAEALRREGFGGRITTIGAEAELPYDRPPLSKQMLKGEWHKERLYLRDAKQYQTLGLDLRLGTRMVSLDDRAKRVMLSDGDAVVYDALIAATGVQPRNLSLGANLAGVHVLRTLDDVVRIREEIAGAKSIVVVGAGFLGTEVAASSAALGLTVTLLDSGSAPLSGLYGTIVGNALLDLHRQHDVDVQLNVLSLELIETNSRVSQVRLGSGRICAADLVVVAIGCVPVTDWLAGSNVARGEGIECDAYCRAGDSIYAAGDVARWEHIGFRRRMRVEHRMNASEQGENAARNLLGQRTPFVPCPFFWSNQYNVRIQAYGIFPADADVVLEEGDVAQQKFVVSYKEKGERVGVLGWNSSKSLPAYKMTIDALIAERAGARSSELVA